ncbi:collagen alpha-2(I) chain-like isoform X1 [Acinonyx jubatus]|uniref:Collagen alpha-2(I) chain-like isoform X1 n=1 Tax=Acinonyx jubatus TaxID=32536 RepID=A0ABM3NWE2_ACIJB|nr:collagen alpha-2(I) chain-like isoform X1 [Acinonyx jubatus]
MVGDRSQLEGAGGRCRDCGQRPRARHTRLELGRAVESCPAGPAALGVVGAQGQEEKGGRGERRGCSAASGNGAGSQPLGPPGELGCGAGHVHPGVLRVAAARGSWGRPSVGRALPVPLFSELRLLTSQAGPASPNQARGCREKNAPGIAADRNRSGAKIKRERWGSRERCPFNPVSLLNAFWIQAVEPLG